MFYSNPGHPFSSGVTLAKLAAVTIDEQGNETFDTSGALDKLRKVSLFSFLVKAISQKGNEKSSSMHVKSLVCDQLHLKTFEKRLAPTTCYR